MKKNDSYKPLISIAMATYNGEKYLKKQLDSIYAQTYRNIEVIVSDDCSTDATVEILKQYSTMYGLKYYANKTNLGFVKNFEKAISFCNGEYIALADQDDVWESNKIQRLLEEIGDNLMIHSDCKIIDENNTVISEYSKAQKGNEVEFKSLFFRNVVTGCTVLFKRDLLLSALPFPEGILYHDWWLAVCAASKKRIVYIGESLVQYRQHSNQNTGLNSKVFFLFTVLNNIYLRIKNDKTLRIREDSKHLRQIKALLADERSFILEQKHFINEVIEYHHNYINGILHIKTFIIGLKYSKYVFPQHNYLYIKNIIWDIFG